MSTFDSPLSSSRLLTCKEAADFLCLSLRKLWALSASGEIPAVRIGKSVRYSPMVLVAFVAARQGRKK
jgi:excisionase family DNA binding protein